MAQSNYLTTPNTLIGMTMVEIVDEVLEWLPNSWKVGVEQGSKIDLVRDSLILCTNTIKRVANCGSRCVFHFALVATSLIMDIRVYSSEFSEMSFKLTITDASERVIYDDDPHIMKSISWLWRELLVSAASRGECTRPILDDINRLGLKESVFALFRRGDGEYLATRTSLPDFEILCSQQRSAPIGMNTGLRGCEKPLSR